MRIVSLVPSLTRTLFDFGLTSQSIVGRTPWCIHPAGQVEEVPVVGGTKTPTLSKILAAKPDIVVMDKDENPKQVYEWCLNQGLKVFVCDVRHPRDVPDMLRDLGHAVQCVQAGEQLAKQLEEVLHAITPAQHGIGVPLIWHSPLMSANASTYAGGMLTTLGFQIPHFGGPETGYPEVTPEEMVKAHVTDIFLSSEPHAFTDQQGRDLLTQFSALQANVPRIHFIDGEDLTWMGSHTAQGLLNLRMSLANASPR